MPVYRMTSAPTPVRWLVVDAGAMTSVDYSAARVLRTLQDDLIRARVVLVLVHAEASLLADLARHRVIDRIGSRYIFATLHEALAGIRDHRLDPASGGSGP